MNENQKAAPEESRWSSARRLTSATSETPLTEVERPGSLWWLRVEGKAGLSEEGVDEVGSALDVAEPGADDGLELVEGGGGMVAQAAFHG